MRMIYSNELPKIQVFRLYLSLTKVSDEGFKQFVKVTLPSMKNLRTLYLDLEDTWVTDSGVIPIFKGLDGLRSLEICLCCTRVTDKAIMCFLEKQKELKALVDLKFCLSNTAVSCSVQSQIEKLSKCLPETN